MTIRNGTVRALALGIPATVAALGAVPQRTHAEEVTPELRREVVDGLSGLLEDLYVIPETAEAMTERLHGDLEAGRFDSVKDAAELAEVLTGILQDMSGDQHLRVTYGGSAGDPCPAPARVRIVRSDGAEDGGSGEGSADGGPRIVRRVAGSGASPPELEQIEPFPRAEILPGNVACIEVRLFASRERAEDRAVEVMKTIADADAVVFDLRGCMGGSPDMIHLIISYLYGQQPMHLLTYYHGHQEPDSAYTLAEVPGLRRPEIPVFIATSAFTGSGGEEFTYDLKHHGRATVVGEVTAGAGHGGGVHPVAAGFEAFIPDFRPVHPATGTGWEGVGVEPDLEVPADRALDVAHREALREMVRRRPERAAELADEIARLDSRIEQEPAPIGVDALREYAGVYGIRTLRVKDGVLTLQRTGGPELELIPGSTPDEFTLKIIPSARIRFERDEAGAVTAVRVLNMQGQWETSERGGMPAP